MAPSQSRQLLIWTLPTIAVLFSYLWYKRKRLNHSGDKIITSSNKAIEDAKKEQLSDKEIDKDSEAAIIDALNYSTSSSSTSLSCPSSTHSTPKKISRSLSGVDSQPIDIIIPPKLKATKSNPVVISDEDLDLEIEKIKSMKPETTSPNNNRSICSSSSSSKSEKTKSISPPKETFTSTPTKVATSVIINSPMRKMAQKSLTSTTTNEINNKKQKQPVVENSAKAPSTTSSSSVRDERRNSERDSANHSPADVMLASPSLSSISDNHSEGSNDSGKGGSDVATPPPSRTADSVVVVNGNGGADDGVVVGVNVYEFLIPQFLVGKLIGKRGCFVAQIKDKTGAHVIVRKHPTNSKMKVCGVEGTQHEIDSALKLIRDKFPLKRFPEVTLEQVSFYSQMPTIHLAPVDQLYLKLIEGINNDTIVSCMVAPNHLFLQQHNHPTFPNLNILTDFMNKCYSEVDSPLLPTPIPDNTICAAYSVNSWYRAIILSTDDETSTCYVKFLDYGGYAYVEQSKLRQIRGDFMLLPFQASECFLANVKPIGDGGWAEEAYNAVADMTKGTIIYTQIADYTEDGIPLVNCYLLVGPQHIVFLNQELVNLGYAEWLSTSSTSVVVNNNNGEEAAGVSTTLEA